MVQTGHRPHRLRIGVADAIRRWPSPGLSAGLTVDKFQFLAGNSLSFFAPQPVWVHNCSIRILSSSLSRMTQQIWRQKLSARFEFQTVALALPGAAFVQSQNRPRLLPHVFLKNHSTYVNGIDVVCKQIDWASLQKKENGNRLSRKKF